MDMILKLGTSTVAASVSSGPFEIIMYMGLSRLTSLTTLSSLISNRITLPVSTVLLYSVVIRTLVIKFSAAQESISFLVMDIKSGIGKVTDRS